MHYASISPVRHYQQQPQINAVYFSNVVERKSHATFHQKKIYDRNATQQSPKRIPKVPFDNNLIQSQQVNSSMTNLTKYDAPVTIRGENYKYIGQVCGTYKDGVGQYFDYTGTIIYEGEWKLNKYHGFGKLYNEGYLAYQGQFENGNKQGAGIEYFMDGSYFVGNFVNNKRNGIGTLYCKQNKMGVWKDDTLVEQF